MVYVGPLTEFETNSLQEIIKKHISTLSTTSIIFIETKIPSVIQASEIISRCNTVTTQIAYLHQLKPNI